MSLPENPVLRIAMVAGETSGDMLGAGLIKAIKEQYPDAIFFGIGGERMIAEGFVTIVPMERLAVMGLVEVIGRLWELLGIQHTLYRHILEQKPNVFVGIDAPDFNLPLEKKLRDANILTVHYVSPSVWAWRPGRVKKIVQSTDLMLTLLPFEAAFYQDHNMPVKFVGHPLADQIPLVNSKQQARDFLAVEQHKEVIAILPGSRGGEIKYLGETFIKTAQYCFSKKPNLQFIIPCVNAARKQEVKNIIEVLAPELPITLLDGHAQQAMAAADTILLASGTATLEALLLKKPMVVAYRVAAITFMIAKWLVKIPFISLPNLLAGREVVPEILQTDATPQKLGDALLAQLADKNKMHDIEQCFHNTHLSLKHGADHQAASAIIALITERGKLPTTSNVEVM